MKCLLQNQISSLVYETLSIGKPNKCVVCKTLFSRSEYYLYEICRCDTLNLNVATNNLWRNLRRFFMRKLATARQKKIKNI